MGMVTHAIETDGPVDSGVKREFPLADYMQRAEERQLWVRIRPMSQSLRSMRTLRTLTWCRGRPEGEEYSDPMPQSTGLPAR